MSLISFYTIRKFCQPSQEGVLPVQKAGYLLVEALFAIAFLSILSLVLAYYQGAVAQWQQEASQRLQAVSVASSLIDQVIRTGKVPKSGGQNGPFKASWQQLPSNLEGFHPFKLAVSWGSENKSLTFYSGIVSGKKKN